MDNSSAIVEFAVSDDIQRIEQLFQGAVDLPQSQRSAFLERECDGDEELKAHVERLVARMDKATLDSPSGDDALLGPLPTAVITEGPGTVIGRYKLLQVIGEGGFGVVYMAEQQEPVVRKVALKIIKLGMDTREVVARFEAERQALAMMDHPNIAKVLDGGATQSGRPYFVMELVRGVSFTEFCEKNDLNTRERLELFLSVCHAVQHAHQKGVSHRDLKPSNVMVTMRDDCPMPKVIDFGIAKAMHARLTEKTLFTRYEQFVGTPAYMSPEQAEMSALDVDTRTDIYSLGVLLYEVLTGTTPFDDTTLRKAGLAEILRIIREEQPPRPSLRISTASGNAESRAPRADVPGLSRVLRGDLDWIVMMALEKDRTRRYATAGELADDIRRHLHDEPVKAGPPGTTYRLKKFLSRNRTSVTAASLVAMALVAGIIGTTWGLIQSRQNATRATRQTQRAVAAMDFLLSTLSLANPEVARNPNVSVQTLLDHTAARIDKEFGEDPIAEIRLRSTIGRAYARLGLNVLAEPHLRRVAEMLDEIPPQDESAWKAMETAGFDAVQRYKALWALTNVTFHLQRDDCFMIAAKAREVGLDHVAQTQPALADALRGFMRGVTADAWSRDDGAMKEVPELFEQSVALANQDLPEGDPKWPIVADTLLTGGYTIWYTPHEPLAERFWRQSLQWQRRELPANHPDIDTTVNLLVGVLNRLGKLDESQQLIEDSVQRLRTVFSEDALPVALAEGTLGETLTKKGRFEEAERILLASHKKILANVVSESNYMAMESFKRVVSLYEDWGRPEETAPYRDAIAHACAFGKYVQQWAVLKGAMGDRQSQLVAAANRAAELTGGPSYVLSRGVLHLPEINPIVDELVASLKKIDVTDARSAALARLMLAWSNGLDPVKHLTQRQLLAESALPPLQHWADQLPLEAAEAFAVLAECAQARSDFPKAAQFAQQASRGLVVDSEDGDWMRAAKQVRIARCLLESGMFGEAERPLQNGYQVLRNSLSEYHSETAAARALLHRLYTQTGRHREAGDYQPITSTE